MDDELIERGLDLYRETARALHLQAAPVWREVELSMAQLRALFTLVDGGPMPIGRVARQVGIGLPAASSLVDRLVEHGFVVRREDLADRRRTLASASEAGELLAQRLRHGSREALRGWLQRLPPERLAALVGGLEALAEAATSSPERQEVATR
jgi:DNA-binding MarR family transcriptional regulator